MLYMKNKSDDENNNNNNNNVMQMMNELNYRIIRSFTLIIIMRIFYGTYRYIYNRIPVVFFASKSTIQRTGIPILVLSTGRTPMKPNHHNDAEANRSVRTYQRERDIYIYLFVTSTSIYTAISIYFVCLLQIR